MKRLLRLIVAAAVTTGTLACGSPADQSSSQAVRTGQLQPHYDREGRLQKLEYDRNEDGRVDTWGYMDGPRVVKIEVDENGDGTVDRWEYHTTPPAADASANSPGGVDRTLERIERATRFDGKVSRREYFVGGTLSKIEEDTDGDGRLDKWETYANGTLSVMSLDTRGRGTPDRRFLYSVDGSLDHIETDASGSGRFQPVTP
jgi:hypothetical protein